MGELKLRQLHRGYVLTDFEANEIGIRDSEHAIDEIKKLLKLDEQQSIKQDVQKNSKMLSQEIQPIRQEKPDFLELQAKILEKAKEQISLTGKVNGTKIARELGMNYSTVHHRLKKLTTEIDELIKKRQKEHDKPVSDIDTKTSTKTSDIDTKTSTKTIDNENRKIDLKLIEM